MAHVTIEPQPKLSDILYICERLRDRDREEIFALRWHDDPSALAQEIHAIGGFSWCAYLDGEPVAIIGAFPPWPNVWSAFAFGTDKWPRVVKALARHALTFMRPGLINAGAIRLFCWAMEKHTDARRWLEFLGAKPEIKLDNYGKNGQAFVCYGWTRTNKPD